MTPPERREGFHEMSRAVGRIEGEVLHLKKGQAAQEAKLNNIEAAVVGNKTRIATLAGGISVAMSFAYHWISGNFHR